VFREGWSERACCQNAAPLSIWRCGSVSGYDEGKGSPAGRTSVRLNEPRSDQTGRTSGDTATDKDSISRDLLHMFKFVTIVAAAIPVFLFLRNIFGRSPVVKQAVADFRRQIDYLVWIILFCIAVGMVYSAVNLIHPSW
jgi:hypothetical protein